MATDTPAPAATAAPAATEPPAGSPWPDGYPLRWIAFAVVLAAEIMDLLDALITTIAGPTIVRDLGGGDTLIQWLAAGYTLAMAAGLLVGGRLGDIYGRRRVFLVGMAGFTLMSLACALAPSPEALIAFRVLQGGIGAVMLPQGLGLIKEMFPPRQLAKAFGAFGPVMGLSAVAGPILAGWLVDADVAGMGWRAIFAINLPLGVAALVVGLRALPPSRPDRSLHVDVPSAALAGASMVALIYPLIQGRELGWPWWTFALAAAGVAGFALLAVLEARRDRMGRVTLITPTLFRKRAFSAGLVAGMGLFSALMGLSIVFTLFVQFGLGFDPLKAGIAGIPEAIGMIVGFVASQKMIERFGGRRAMHVGVAVSAVGLGLFILTLRLAGDGIGILDMTPAMAVMGVGFGLAMAPFFDIVLAGVDDHESGSASGLLTAVQQLGGAVGVAALGTLFFHALDGAGRGATRVTEFRDATSLSLWLAVALLGVTFVLTWLLPRRAREGAAGH